MFSKFKKPGRPNETKFSFGAASAIITILGLVVGLDTMTDPKLSIIGGILVIALADNISDSMGIHIYQESECLGHREIWMSTITNFLTRLVVSFTFILIVYLLPIKIAVPCAVLWGFGLLSFISYAIARERGVSPLRAIMEHMSIAAFVVGASHMVGRFVVSRFQ